MDAMQTNVRSIAHVPSGHMTHNDASVPVRQSHVTVLAELEQRPLGSWRHFSTKLHEFWLKELQKNTYHIEMSFFPYAELERCDG